MRTFQDICTPYSRISVAGPQDNELILNFFRHSAMNLKEGSISFDRSPDFFALHRLQGEFSKTILLWNSDRTLTGVAAYTSIRGTYQGELVTWTYASDLRFSPRMESETKHQFRKFYGDLVLHLKDLRDLGNPDFMLSIISDDNTRAKDVFLKRKGDVIYRPLFSFRARVILGKLPFLSASSDQVQRCRASEVVPLREFLERETKKKRLSFSLQEIESRLRMLNISWEDFLLIKGHEGNIIAAALATSENEFRRPLVKIKGIKTRALGLLSSLLGRPWIFSDQGIQTSTLAYITIDHNQTAQRDWQLRSSLINKAWRQSEKSQGRVLILLDNTLGARSLMGKGFISLKAPGTVYQICHRRLYKKSHLLRRVTTQLSQIETTFL